MTKAAGIEGVDPNDQHTERSAFCRRVVELVHMPQSAATVF